jgi:hypothetical protein
MVDAYTALVNAIQEATGVAHRSIGPGRGSGARDKYLEGLTIALIQVLESTNPFLRVVRDWPVAFNVAGVEVEDKEIPLVISVAFDAENKPFAISAPGHSGAQPSFDHEEVQGILPLNVRLAPIITIEANTSTRPKPFSREFITNARTRAEAIGAPAFVLVNFGRGQRPRIWHPTSDDETHTAPINARMAPPVESLPTISSPAVQTGSAPELPILDASLNDPDDVGDDGGTSGAIAT